MPLGWSVIKELLALRRRLDELLEAIEGEVDVPGLAPPPADLYESDSEIVVIVELPGVEPESIELQLHEDRLRVAGRYSRSEPTCDTRWLRMERPPGHFQREFVLTDRRVGSTPAAHLERGVLTVRLPLSGVHRRSIPVQGKEVES